MLLKESYSHRISTWMPTQDLNHGSTSWHANVEIREASYRVSPLDEEQEVFSNFKEKKKYSSPWLTPQVVFVYVVVVCVCVYVSGTMCICVSVGKQKGNSSLFLNLNHLHCFLAQLPLLGPRLTDYTRLTVINMQCPPVFCSFPLDN